MSEMIQLNLFDVIGELERSNCGFTEKSQKMIEIMLDTGMSPKALSVLLAMLDLRKEHLHYFNAPIISSRSMWKDALPGWLKKAIYKERLEIICNEHNQGEVGIYAGLTEAVAVLMPSSLEAPLNYEYANIYMWTAKQASIKYQGKTVDDFKGICDLEKLPRFEQEQLNRFSRGYPQEGNQESLLKGGPGQLKVRTTDGDKRLQIPFALLSTEEKKQNTGINKGALQRLFLCPQTKGNMRNEDYQCK